MKIFISILTILFCINFSSQVFAANAAGVASIFKITLTKIELCTATPLDGKNDTTCTGSTTVGTGNKEFDVASVDAGAQVGSFVSTAGLPIGTTFTHAKPTMSREVKVKGYVEIDSNCWCRTESDSTYNSSTGKYKSVLYGVCETSEADAIANAEEGTYYIQTDTTDGTTICANAACDSGSNQSMDYTKDTTSLNAQYGLAMNDPAIGDTTFDMIYQLESNYTVGVTSPKIDIAFGTQTALFANEWTDGSCYVEPYYVRSTVTISE